jgi:hypothetical protein
LSQARAAKKELASLVAGDPGVNGIGICRGSNGFAVKLNVSGAAKVNVPKTIKGVQVQVEVVGEIRKQLA